ncbi:MAG: hypothetical protein CYPHOPRED_001812 [Cyphobasidiales sp. Tagirdzhanova-0007]|nr:MAG: hypothetical protein CYPHOPRED_001812 [Cyphobasidiales sp. Tagirdzhanova-0007]
MADAGQRALAERSDGTSTNGIPTLRGPFMDLKYIAQNNRDVAKQLRVANKELLRSPKTAISTYVNALSGREARYSLTSLLHVSNGNQRIVQRATVLVNAQNGIKGVGDSENFEEAETLAALHAIIVLFGQGLIDKNGIPVSSPANAILVSAQ